MEQLKSGVLFNADACWNSWILVRYWNLMLAETV